MSFPSVSNQQTQSIKWEQSRQFIVHGSVFMRKTGNSSFHSSSHTNLTQTTDHSHPRPPFQLALILLYVAVISLFLNNVFFYFSLSTYISLAQSDLCLIIKSTCLHTLSCDRQNLRSRPISYFPYCRFLIIIFKSNGTASPRRPRAYCFLKMITGQCFYCFSKSYVVSNSEGSLSLCLNTSPAMKS